MRGHDDELIRRQLESLTHAELVARLLSLAGRDDALRVVLVAEAEAAAGTLDVKELRKELTAQLRVRNRTFDWRYARTYAGEAGAALDVLDGLLDAGHAEAVIDLAEHCMNGRRPSFLKRLDKANLC